MPAATPPPVQPLHARLAGCPLDTASHDGPAAYRVVPLQAWLREYLHPNLAHRVALRLRFTLDVPGTEMMTVAAQLAGCPDEHSLLERIDMALQLDEMLHFEVDVLGVELDPAYTPRVHSVTSPLTTRWPLASHRARQAERLEQLLRDGSSPYQVQWQPPARLIRRLDATVTASVNHTTAVAEPPAGELLRDAWRQAYGLDPNPTTAYRQAVRAVEEVACPLVLPTDDDRTLGKVIAHLKQGGHKWRFVLLDRAGTDTVDPLVGMLDRLWTGQVSRHSGSEKSRDQTQAEAEAAVHLAATLVQLLTSGALTRRDTP